MAHDIKIFKTPLVIKHIIAWILYIIFSYIVNYMTAPDTMLIAVIAFTLLYILIFYGTLFNLYHRG